MSLDLPFYDSQSALGISQTDYEKVFFFDRNQQVPGFFLYQGQGLYEEIHLPNEDQLFQTRNLIIRGSSLD